MRPKRDTRRFVWERGDVQSIQGIQGVQGGPTLKTNKEPTAGFASSSEAETKARSKASQTNE